MISYRLVKDQVVSTGLGGNIVRTLNEGISVDGEKNQFHMDWLRIGREGKLHLILGCFIKTNTFFLSILLRTYFKCVMTKEKISH